MNPKEIGSIHDPAPKRPELEAPPLPTQPDADGGGVRSSVNEADGGGGDSDSEFVPRGPEVDEHVLVNQDFLLDADMSVREFLIQNSVEVVDFVRFECGEVIEPTYCE